ncbi:MAG: hypothetical protein Unbinned2072contig1001_28 [Prokaryotic dsDNA virus sp.]|nr:MAG: hypothetical protein Unbinned2072contig1001_28 [Prokaryotic dsDNA virus sp.]|tara:strand:+ start:3779 stop:4111 length:333 start_codon:yes stop_codon:yes gene_type:complete
MRAVIISIFCLMLNSAYAQYKNDISIVQFTADFVESESLKKFKNHNTFTFILSKHTEYFEKENIKVVPTIVLYNNGKEIIRVKSNIMLELPDDWEKQIANEIDELLKNKF